MRVIDAEYLAVTGARLALVRGAHSLEAVWIPFFTPSRLPLDDQRWIGAASVEFVDGDEPDVPGGSQAGIRWGHTRERFEYLALLLRRLQSPAERRAGRIAARFPGA